MRVRLPSPNNIQDQALREYLSQLVQALERAIEKLPETPFTRDAIKITGLTKTYSLDASAATLSDTRLVLGTLIQLLRDSGKIA